MYRGGEAVNICVVSPGRIPAVLYGGTERVVGWLIRGLVRMGHEVSLVAPEGSVHPDCTRVVGFERTGRNINVTPPHLASLVPSGTDIVHLHFAYAGELDRPMLKTVHGYPFHYTGRAVYAAAQEFDAGTSFVSDAHRRTCGRPDNPFVHNGLDSDEYIFREEKRDYLLFLGKVDWNVKGLELALRLAEQSGQRLVIAGDFLDPCSYRTSLRPRLSSRITYAGPVGGRDKADLLADARALLFPTLWPEPFGLVAIEAMVSGTPVLGTLNGALPEIVRHGETGFLARRPSETLQQLTRLDTIDPHVCRRHVLEHFTAEHMVRGYLRLYLQRITQFRRELAGMVLKCREPDLCVSM